ncbi:hypothetical protein BD289DRAFT_1419 [Coniella lustricola]|uniref:AB hydrolase-1 domain-containing protein n=1 Tax=Coniella lustricola TaxID=2025994 RepID=A0A2T3ANG5_9PEZI|nr:hypothetical protein BD289DRAFT_1419 [Coniella lustricola]
MDAVPPPIARHGRHAQTGHGHGQRDDLPLRRLDTAASDFSQTPRPLTRSDSVAPASPEVISSLITSLSVISRPAADHFDRPLDAIAASPKSSVAASPSRRVGSFGVDYGAFSPSTSDVHDDFADLDDLAAAPPIVKTAKPPSGFSPLTAPKSPSFRDSGGLRSFLSSRNTSRPSSRGSSASRDADLPSLGNISVERGRSPTASPTDAKRQASAERWGKKTGRSQTKLAYINSKERLRDSEERKRGAMDSAVGGDSSYLAASAMSRGAVSPRLDMSFADTPINEEPSSVDDAYTNHGASSDSAMSPRGIPHRDSSLRKPGKRSSVRLSRTSKHDSTHGAIPEEDYFAIGAAMSDWNESLSNGRSSLGDTQSAKPSDRNSINGRHGDGLLGPSWATTSKANHYIDHYVTDTEVDIDDGAPSPNIAQGKSRDRDFSRDRNSHRRSGRSTPELRVKRSSSRMKRLSGTLSPRGEDQPREDTPTLSVAYERPQSADSIDDAVEAYMRSPRLSQTIHHAETGRAISFSEVGDPEGSAVFCCVGMGLTRYITAFYDELALTLKLRLITPDRPGVGDSEAYASGTATPLSWPDDVYAICQALKITKFSILAHSAGAIYALATALRMPQHIRGRIHLLAPWIPPSQMSVFGASSQSPLPPSNAIPTSQKILRALPTPILKAANSSFMSATSSSLTSSLPKQKRTKRKPSSKDVNKGNADRAAATEKENHSSSDHSRIPPDMPTLTRGMVATEEMDQIRPEGASPMSPVSIANRLHGENIVSGTDSSSRDSAAALAAADLAALAEKERQENYDIRLTQAIWELATTGANPAVDLLVCLERRHTIGFRYVDITRPVIIHHGSRDTRVPVENVKWLGKMMRRCEVRVLEGEGHGLMASAMVMGTVLMEISKEWEDWNKATGQTGQTKRADTR